MRYKKGKKAIKNCPLCNSPVNILKFDWAHGRFNEGDGFRIKCVCGLTLEFEDKTKYDYMLNHWNNRIYKYKTGKNYIPEVLI